MSFNLEKILKVLISNKRTVYKPKNDLLNQNKVLEDLVTEYEWGYCLCSIKII